MQTHVEKANESKSQLVANAVSYSKNDSKSTMHFNDNRPETAQLKRLQELANSSPGNLQLAQLQKIADQHSARQALPVQKKPNNTGLPDNLKSNIEDLSGYSMDDVKVHYNSDKPAQLQAHAYAQGTDIHLAPGQEKHLPHEIWHVVQQKQGRVKPTAQMKGKVNLNDDEALEKEADVMGERVLKMNSDPESVISRKSDTGSVLNGIVQRLQIGKLGMEAEVLRERFSMWAMNHRDESRILDDPEVVLEEFSLGTLDDNIDVTLDNEVKLKNDMWTERSFTVEFVSKAVEVNTDDVAKLERMENAWIRAGHFWKTNLLGERKVIGMAGANVDWFKKNEHWEAPQFDKYGDNRNVSPGDEGSRLYWDGPGFVTYIKAKTEDPEVAIQITFGSILKALDAANLATSRVLFGNDAPDSKLVSKGLEHRNQVFGEDVQPEAMALLKILRDYRTQSFDADIKNLTGETKPKRYQKEYISLMIRTSLSSVFDGMSEEGRTTFIGWVVQYGEKGTGPISGQFLEDPMQPFFTAATTKEPQANAITIAEVLVSIINKHLPEEDRDEVKPGDAFSQVRHEDTGAPLAGFGEINESNPDQIKKYGLDHPSEMMRGITGVIAENRAAKVRKLSELPLVFRQLIIALREVEKIKL